MKKQIKDYPAYDIYSDGRVFSRKRGKFLKPCKNNSGYNTVNLYNGTIEGRRSCSIHELVAENFIEKPADAVEVNHKDGNKDHNDYTNLEWITHSDNLNHAYENNLHHKQRAVKCLENNKTYRSCMEVERELECDHRMVSAVCSGKRKSHHNLHFEYV